MTRTDYDHIVVDKREFDNPTMNKEFNIDKYRHIARIPKNESFLFPHKENCLGIIIKLEDDSHVVAQIGMFDLGFEQTSLLGNIYEDRSKFKSQTDLIIELFKDKLPLAVTFIGNKDSWKNGDFENLEIVIIEANEDVSFNYDNFTGDNPVVDVYVNKKGEISFDKPPALPEPDTTNPEEIQDRNLSFE